MKTLLISSEISLVKEILSRGSHLKCLDSLAPVEHLIRLTEKWKPNLIVLFGTTIIVPVSILQKTRVINIHSSMLPNCRGPVPHLWSALEGRGFGVTIHEVDEGIDTGKIIFQELIDTKITSHTLSSIYELLHARAALLLCKNWNEIRDCTYTTHPQNAEGSIHTMKMQCEFQNFLKANLDEPLPWLVDQIKTKWLKSRS